MQIRMAQFENLATSPAGSAGLLNSFFLAKQKLRDPQPKPLFPYASGARQKEELGQPTRCGCAAYSGPLLLMTPEGVQKHRNKVKATMKKGSPKA